MPPEQLRPAFQPAHEGDHALLYRGSSWHLGLVRKSTKTGYLRQLELRPGEVVKVVNEDPTRVVPRGTADHAVLERLRLEGRDYPDLMAARRALLEAYSDRAEIEPIRSVPGDSQGEGAGPGDVGDPGGRDGGGARRPPDARVAGDPGPPPKPRRRRATRVAEDVRPPAAGVPAAPSRGDRDGGARCHQGSGGTAEAKAGLIGWLLTMAERRPSEDWVRHQLGAADEARWQEVGGPALMGLLAHLEKTGWTGSSS